MPLAYKGKWGKTGRCVHNSGFSDIYIVLMSHRYTTSANFGYRQSGLSMRYLPVKSLQPVLMDKGHSPAETAVHKETGRAFLSVT